MKITQCFEKQSRPVKVLQFGEGNFLRAFVDSMLSVANEKTDFNGNILVVQPIQHGDISFFKQQKDLYTVMLRGVQNGEVIQITQVVDTIEKVINPYTDFDEYMDYAKEETLRFVVSNTTEAGIVFDPTDQFTLRPAKSYPGKLTQFLYKRWKHFQGDLTKGLVHLPVELIENNGDTLKKCVYQQISNWKLEKKFADWIEESCVFANTLVDRIVTGFPKEEAEELWKELGYEDRLLVTGEPFALWVIQSDRDLSVELPLNQIGLPVVFTSNIKPYRDRKVRILNGAHTAFSLASYLMGNNTVLASMEDPVVHRFISTLLFQEVIPTLELPKEDCENFAFEVLDRFKNPYNKHLLLSIALNSLSKWQARCLPSVKEYLTLKGKAPVLLAFSLAALLHFYDIVDEKEGRMYGDRNGEGYPIVDDQQRLLQLRKLKNLDPKEKVKKILADTTFFGEDITKFPLFANEVVETYHLIKMEGMGQGMMIKLEKEYGKEY
ncbi:MAG: tagaturonate reductase [Clostridiales bacterium]|nr:tagaturonate reductase [Clostridiales bacterium]